MAQRKGFYHRYITEGDITKFEVINRKNQLFEVIIDTKNLQKLIDLDYAWQIIIRDGYLYYDSSHHYIGTFISKHPEYEQILLHNIILGDSNKDYNVDHINHNTLDYREENLRIIEVNNNSKNRKSKNKNNRSGYRNVSLVNNKWVI